MANFSAAYQNTMNHEGSYSNDPRDRGGETWKGIARNCHPGWAGWEIIDEVKGNVTHKQLVHALNMDSELEDLVIKFYFKEFWCSLMLGFVDQQDIAEELFDTAVNMGVVPASKMFQKALNLLNRDQKDYEDLIVDGNVGTRTITAYMAFMSTQFLSSRSVDKNVKTLLKVLNGLQFQRYTQIVESSPGQEVFFYGWINRT